MKAIPIAASSPLGLRPPTRRQKTWCSCGTSPETRFARVLVRTSPRASLRENKRATSAGEFLCRRMRFLPRSAGGDARVHAPSKAPFFGGGAGRGSILQCDNPHRAFPASTAPRLDSPVFNPPLSRRRAKFAMMNPSCQAGLYISLFTDIPKILATTPRSRSFEILSARSMKSRWENQSAAAGLLSIQFANADRVAITLDTTNLKVGRILRIIRNK